MAKTRVQLNRKGVIELMKSDEITDALKEQAVRISSQVKDSEIDVYRNGKTRSNVSVSVNHGDPNDLLRAML